MLKLSINLVSVRDTIWKPLFMPLWILQSKERQYLNRIQLKNRGKSKIEAHVFLSNSHFRFSVYRTSPCWSIKPKCFSESCYDFKNVSALIKQTHNQILTGERGLSSKKKKKKRAMKTRQSKTRYKRVIIFLHSPAKENKGIKGEGLPAILEFLSYKRMLA